MSSKIRSLHHDDLTAIQQIADQFRYNTWSQAVFADCLKAGYLGWVIEDELNQVIGFLIVLVHDAECQLMNIGVDQQHWRCGYAKQLLHYLFEYLNRHGVSHILLEVRASNHAAINLYKRQQFRQIGIRKNYYPCDAGKEDALVFVRQ